MSELPFTVIDQGERDFWELTAETGHAEVMSSELPALRHWRSRDVQTPLAQLNPFPQPLPGGNLDLFQQLLLFFLREKERESWDGPFDSNSSLGQAAFVPSHTSCLSH